MNEVAAAIKPSVFEYTCHRAYLKAIYNYKKATQPGFSFRVFSRIAGFSSPNFLKLVMEGERNLSNDSLEKLLRALKLTSEESVFFRNLVRLNQAGSVEDRKLYAEQILRSRAYRKLKPLNQALYEYCAKWYHIPIREMVTLSGFIADPEWIARALEPPISTAEARSALETLFALGMLRKEEGGRISQAESIVSSGDEVSSASVGQYHQKMISMGAEAIDRFPSGERDISSLTLSLSESGAGRVKALIQRFRKELLALADAEEDPTRVYQLNFQIFPISRRTP
ncbi:MAG: TIGR02147 family protein [Oligoflexia bacterium]|nr:TIGR02147 family protein [Oligoflexia bacterium]